LRGICGGKSIGLFGAGEFETTIKPKQGLDGDVHLDETQWLLVELGRANMISDQEAITLNTRYAKEQSEALQV
jgi:hypothetical protein